MAMTFLQRRLTSISISSRLLLVLSVAVFPLLLFVLASACWQPGPSAAGAAMPDVQSLQVAMAGVSRGVPDAARRQGALDATPLTLAALGLAAAWGLGRKLLVLPAGSDPLLARLVPRLVFARLWRAAVV